MLIATRFGATAQVHHVEGPMRDRRQLTFHEETVSEAWTIPGSDAFVYSRDTGGDEWFQLYSRPVGGAEVRQLTEPALSDASKSRCWSCRGPTIRASRSRNRTRSCGAEGERRGGLVRAIRGRSPRVFKEAKQRLAPRS
jgi:hypothetical protein